MQATLDDLAAWKVAAAESYDRMRAHAVAELSQILGEPVHLDEDGAIVLDEEQRERLLAAVPVTTTSEAGFHFDTAWGVPIHREGSAS